MYLPGIKPMPKGNIFQVYKAESLWQIIGCEL